jgi:hypothetical protein
MKASGRLSTSLLVACVMLNGCAAIASSTSPAPSAEPPADTPPASSSLTPEASSSATPTPDASIPPTPTSIPTLVPEPNDVDRLLAKAGEHLGSEVEVTAVICDVAEGGPLLFLEDGAGDCRIIVLIDIRLSNDQVRGNWTEYQPATVTGFFGRLTAENVDRIESEWLEGEGFVSFWKREGYRYVIIATRIVQRSKVWPDDY